MIGMTSVKLESSVVPTEQLLPVLGHDCRPLRRHVLHTNVSPVLRGQNVARELTAQLLKAAQNRKSSSYLITEECLAKLKHCPHGKWQIEKIDILVSHGKVFVTDGEDLGHLLRCPDGQVAESEAGAVKDVCEPSDLVLLVPEQGLQTILVRV